MEHVGFTKPDGTGGTEEYLFVTKKGDAYVAVSPDTFKPYNTPYWREATTWDEPGGALEYKKSAGDKEWVLVRIVGLLLDFNTDQGGHKNG